MKLKHHDGRGGLRGWISEHVFLLILIPCGLVIVASLVISGMILFGPHSETTVVTDHEPEQGAADESVRYYSRLTGLPLESEAMISSAATCVMVENSPNARPQSGLREAGVVYEAIAEGGITRFMAVYQFANATPQQIGPVRSVRMYYLEWAIPYNCTIAHAGGAGDALAAIVNYRHISENSVQYWRAKDRYAPHNLYTSAERQMNYNTSKGYTSSEFTGLKRAVDYTAPTRTGASATEISFNFTGATWNVNYTYDAATNSYLRAFQSGGAHMDKDINGVLTQNSPKVVIAIMTTDVPRPYSPYRNVTTIGSGVAHIFQNGEYIAGTWSRNSASEELSFKTTSGKPIVFSPGQTWITSIPNTKSVIWQ